MNRDFSYIEMKKALDAMTSLLQGNPNDYEISLSRYGVVGDLVAELDQFQVYVLDLTVLS